VLKVTLFKLASVRSVLELGYVAFFSDIDVVFLADPVPALFMTAATSAHPMSTSAGVLQNPMADFVFMQVKRQRYFVL
jgi:hypothetical protein